MREIKFRAWDKELNQMFYANTEQLDNGLALLIDGHFDDENPIWMEYTGLKDKNGKEIYEGDILLFASRQGEKSIGHIVFENAAFQIKWVESEYFRTDLDYWNIKIEVISNIYENPELLQDEDLRVLGMEADVYSKKI